MSSISLSTPVVFLIFNRPDTTARVFDAIARARPSCLFVVADGPRAHKPGEAEKCAQTRAIVEKVDWDCDVTRDFSDANLGCRRRVASGLDNVFAQVERAIILEDDCLPDPSFFPFCEELLARYEDDERVMHISGDNFQMGKTPISDSYYFSRYPFVWGWATWRRAWRRYDDAMAGWQADDTQTWLRGFLNDREAAARWAEIFESARTGKVDSWAYRWTLSCWRAGGLSVVPAVNLIANIGFDGAATHTTGESQIADLPTEPMPFPLRHPLEITRDARADAFTQSRYFSPGAWARVKGRVQSRVRRLRQSYA